MGGEGEGTNERGGGGVTGKGDGEKRLRGGGKGAHGEGKKRKGIGRRDREEDIYTGGEALHRGGDFCIGGWGMTLQGEYGTILGKFARDTYLIRYVRV